MMSVIYAECSKKSFYAECHLWRVSFIMSIIYAECRKKAFYAECHYAKCRWTECRGAVVRPSADLELDLSFSSLNKKVMKSTFFYFSQDFAVFSFVKLESKI